MTYVIAVLLIGAISTWLYAASRGASIRLENIDAALTHFLKPEYRSSFLTIRPKFTPYKFIQFSMYGHEDQSLGLELAFPDAQWSHDYVPELVSYASKHDIAFEVSDSRDSEMKFVFFRFGQSVSDAAKFSAYVLSDVFGFGTDYVFRVRIN